MRISVGGCCYRGQKIKHREHRGKAEKNLRKKDAFTAETQRAQRKPKAKAARFDETEPAATNSTATAKRRFSAAAAGSG
jgi:hypothetical protein